MNYNYKKLIVTSKLILRIFIAMKKQIVFKNTLKTMIKLWEINGLIEMQCISLAKLNEKRC